MSCKVKYRKLIVVSLLLAIIPNLSKVNCDININKTNGENLTSPLVSCSDEKCKAMMRDRMVLVQQKFDDYLRESSSVLNAHHTERLKHSSVIYGLIVAAEENQLSQRCFNEIQQIMHAINRKEIWAMKSE
jgi:hypothetical protein